ncbi:MAG: four helix bundle protein [Acidobacteriota bacterium]
MIRDYRKLKVFQEADALVLEVYKSSCGMPHEERYGLQIQIRRAAVSAACNIVEGSARPKPSDYCRFLHIARSSARETGYLIDLSARLGFLTVSVSQRLFRRYEGLRAGLLRLSETIERSNQSSRWQNLRTAWVRRS